jgi:hypothetical protein
MRVSDESGGATTRRFRHFEPLGFFSSLFPVDARRDTTLQQPDR